MKKLVLNIGGGIGNRLIGLCKGIFLYENILKIKIIN